MMSLGTVCELTQESCAIARIPRAMPQLFVSTFTTRKSHTCARAGRHAGRADRAGPGLEIDSVKRAGPNWSKDPFRV